MSDGRALAWQLSARQWDVLTALLGPGDCPAPIRVRVHGRTDVERRRIRDQVTMELRERGLLGRDGRVDPDLEAALGVLRRPVCWLDSVWLPDESADDPVRLLAARDGTVVICALQRPDQPGATLVEVVAGDEFASAVVRRLPVHPPGTSPAVTTSLGPDGGCASGGVPVSVSTARTRAERSRAAAAAMLERSHLRAGQIAATVRDLSGRLRRSPVLRWCDNPDGRYQVTVAGAPGADHSLTVTPADNRRLIDAVRRLVESLHDR